MPILSKNRPKTPNSPPVERRHDQGRGRLSRGGGAAAGLIAMIRDDCGPDDRLAARPSLPGQATRIRGNPISGVAWRGPASSSTPLDEVFGAALERLGVPEGGRGGQCKAEE